MKKIFLFGFIACYLVGYAQQTKTLQGKVESVTVFLKGATITEQMSTSLKKGINNLVIDNLPEGLDQARISLNAADGMHILSLAYQTETYENIEKYPKVKRIDDSLELLNNAIQSSTYRNDALTLELELLKRNLYIGGTNTGVNIAELQKASDFYRTRQDDIYGKILKEKIQVQNLQLLTNELAVEREEIIQNYTKLSGRLLVQVNCDNEAIYNFKLKYFTYNAAWKPIYDIRVEEVGKPMMLTQKGKILNNTNKNWKDVMLTLSTADPSISISRPDLAVWELDYNNPNYGLKRKAQEVVAGKYNFSNNAGDNVAGKMDLDNVNSLTETSITVSELSNDFLIPGNSDIESNNTPQTIEIKTYTLNTSYEYTGIPKLEAIPYLIGKTADWKNIPLSDGPASIYIGNNFIGESYIDLSVIKDTLEISLGRNKKVVVERKMKEDLTKKSFFGGSITENFTYEITLKNNNNTAIVFELWDQVPVSKQNDIEVNVSEISGAERDMQTGKLTWRFNLQPGDTKKIIITFSVKYPKGKDVKINRNRALQCPDF